MAETVIWEAMCRQAACRVPSVYSSTFFSKRNISIVDQQFRCFNLCWSLAQLKRVALKHHVAIVGGGISGMTCAVALAAWTGCLVTVLEQDTVQLKRFRRAGHRYIHPDLNHRGGGDGYLTYDPTKPTRFPFMNWSGNYAPAFAQDLASKFDHYRNTLNIALHLNTVADAPRSIHGRVQLRVASGGHTRRMAFDAVILATGFGEESLDSGGQTNDTSYWLSGNPLSYRPLTTRRRERVLVSGNGDSAVIELAYILIMGFDHEHIFSFLPTNSLAPRLSRSFAAAVGGLAHREIDEIGVRQWFAETRELHESNPGKRFGRRGFDLRRDLYETGAAAVKDPADFESELLDRLKELASWEIKYCLDNFMLEKIYRPAIFEIIRHDVEVLVTGHTPTIYSTSQAPLNWFLLRVLSHYGAVSYRRVQAERGPVKVPNRRGATDPLAKERFDRVVIRRGPNSSGLAMDKALKAPELNSLMFTPSAEHFVWWMDKDNAYRSRRLVFAQRYKVPLIDEPYPGTPLSANAMLNHADGILWLCHGTRHERKVTELYRRLKACRRFENRRKLLLRLLKIARTTLPLSPKRKVPRA
jgi:hypothetical protein